MHTTHTLHLPDAPRPALYIFEIGLYDWETGERLPVFKNGQPADSAIYLEYLFE
jgi:hypothetical protein